MFKTMTTMGAIALLAISAQPVLADDDDNGRWYEVTVTNITPGSGMVAGQIFNGLVVATHNANFRLFTLGQPASDGLAAVAEDADTSELVLDLMDDPDVQDVQTNSNAPILPGDSASVTVSADKRHRFLSLATMLVTTNDAFAALNGVRLPRRGSTSFFSVAYDAGSEANTENCSDIPGPPCGNPFKRVPVGAEGYVSVHSGIHGIGSPLDIVPEDRDWRNPVTWITVRSLSRDDNDHEDDDKHRDKHKHKDKDDDD